MFDVEKAVGTILIAKPLDAEQRSFYNLTVLATDGTHTAYTQVKLDLTLKYFLEDQLPDVTCTVSL